MEAARSSSEMTAIDRLRPPVFLLSGLLLSYWGITAALHHSFPTLISLYQQVPNDFLAFWSAFQVFAEGGDPYDLALLEEVQKQVHPAFEGAQFFLSPPWLLVLFAPIFSLDFFTAKDAFFALSCFSFVGIGYFSTGLFSSKFDSRSGRALCAGTVTAAICLLFGQLTLFVGLAVLGFIYSIEKRHDLSCGLWMPAILLKPHLSILVLAATGLLVVFQRRQKIAISILISMGSFALLPVLQRATVYVDWFGARKLAESNVSATLPSVLSFLLQPHLTCLLLGTVLGYFVLRSYKSPVVALIATLSFVAGPIFLLSRTEFGADIMGQVQYMPIALAVVIICYRLRNELDTFSLLDYSPALITASLIFAPYAWFYDFVLLLPVAVYIVSSRRGPALLLFSAINLLAGVQLLLHPNLAALFWYPFFVAALFLLRPLNSMIEEKTNGSV